MRSQITPKEFFNELVISFPLLTREMQEEDQFHFQMEIFADYAIEQIKNANTTELIKCFDFLEDRIEFITSDMANALSVSFCETLMLGECASKMREIKLLLPPRLKKHYSTYENWYNDLN